MKKIIAIDLDETLTETLDGVLEFHNYQIKNIPIIKSEITNYYLQDLKKCKDANIGDLDTRQRFYEFLASEKMLTAKTLEHAKEKLIQRKKENYELYIITARIEERENITKKRIEYNLPNIFDTKHILFANHFTEKSKPKRKMCKDIGATIMIEDNFEYAQELAENGIETYLLSKPRNQQYNNNNPLIKKVDSREEIDI